MEIEAEILDCVNDMLEKLVKKIYKQRYYEKNREEILKKEKEKPRKPLTEEQKQKHREALRRYREKVKDTDDYKEKVKSNNQKAREKNREKLNEKCKEWYNKNQEHVRAYRNSPVGVRNRHINHWKEYHVKLNCDFPSWEELYGYYVLQNNCELCGIQFYSDGRKNNKNLDHNHTTGQFRWVVCSKCNHKLGKTDKYFNRTMSELKLLCNLKPVIYKII